MKNTKKKKLGERLVERGSVSQIDLESALSEQRGKTILLGDLLLSRGLVAKEDLAATLKELLGIDYVNVTEVKIDPAVLKYISREVAAESQALPLYKEGNKLVIAMANPQDIRFLDQLRFRVGMEILPVLAFSDEIAVAIDEAYGESSEEASSARLRATPMPASSSTPRPTGIVRSSAELSHQLIPTEDDSIRFEMAKAGAQESGRDAATESELAKQNQNTPAVKIFSTIVLRAFREKASDIHIDPQINGSVVRLRVDGMLRDLMEVPPEIKGALISRIKILADMNISERRAPQDGRIMVQMGANKLDLRVSTLPTQHGEKTVIRLLDPWAFPKPPRIRCAECFCNHKECY
jgi:type IV pilus assembly protein PilB